VMAQPESQKPEALFEAVVRLPVQFLDQERLKSKSKSFGVKFKNPLYNKIRKFLIHNRRLCFTLHGLRWIEPIS
jgi:hypothetical protein